MNAKGQGSGVFQLLISAIVALAILGVLMGILGILPNFLGGQDVTDTARNLLKDAYNQVGTKTSGKIKISKDTSITNKGVAGINSGIESKQVCVGVSSSLADIVDVSSGSDAAAMRYTAAADREVRLGAHCTPSDEFANDIGSSGVLGLAGWDIVESECPGNIDSSNSTISCIIVLLPPR